MDEIETMLKLSDLAVRDLLHARRRHHEQLKRACAYRGHATPAEYAELGKLMREADSLSRALAAKTIYRMVIQRMTLSPAQKASRRGA